MGCPVEQTGWGALWGRQGEGTSHNGGKARSQSGVRMARDRWVGQKLQEGKLYSTGNGKTGREGKDFKGRQFKKEPF